MPLFYFNIRHENELVEDLEGASCEDVDAAKADAAESLREMIADQLRAGKRTDIVSVEIADHNRTGVATVPVAEAIQISLPFSDAQ